MKNESVLLKDGTFIEKVLNMRAVKISNKKNLKHYAIRLKENQGFYLSDKESEIIELDSKNEDYKRKLYDFYINGVSRFDTVASFSFSRKSIEVLKLFAKSSLINIIREESKLKKIILSSNGEGKVYLNLLDGKGNNVFESIDDSFINYVVSYNCHDKFSVEIDSDLALKIPNNEYVIDIKKTDSLRAIFFQRIDCNDSIFICCKNFVNNSI
jgi:hypothetical protein